MELKAIIENGVIKYNDSNYLQKISKFKKANEGKKLIIKFDIYDSPEYFQHKYYRSYVLPDIAKAMGERDNEYVHRFYLKREFCFNPIDSADEIPAKYKDRCVIYVEEKNGKTVIVGYSPSCSDMTYDEMKDFIVKCEHRLLVDLSGHIGTDRTGEDLQKYQHEAKFYRDGAINEKSNIIGEPVAGPVFDETSRDVY